MSPPIEGRHRVLITASLMTASIMQVLDNTIANVALPRIQGSVSATQDQMAWVLTSYIVAAAIMTPMAGWLAGRFGRKRIILISIAGFTLASMLCGIAQSLPQMVLARLLQGACGAALVPMSQAVMLDVYPREQLAKAMSIWVGGVTLGPIMGPALGGWLTDNYNCKFYTSNYTTSNKCFPPTCKAPRYKGSIEQIWTFFGSWQALSRSVIHL